MKISGHISFAVEKPLGKLSKWLRILGFDTIYEQDVAPVQFSAIDNKGRILLTRRCNTEKRYDPMTRIFIRPDHVFEQMKEVISLLGLSLKDIQPFSRCIRCNGAIERVDKKEVIDKVPDYVWETRNSFRVCVGCKRIYWPGSHTLRADGIIKKLFET
jgi:hypothetical protein